MKAKIVCFSEMSKFLSYEFETGVLRWKKNFHLSKVGKDAGTINNKGYLVIKVKGELYSAARIAWCLHYGQIDPDMQIDHIDRNRLNNRISNLRLVTPSVNCKNRTNKYGDARYYTKHKNGFQVQKDNKYIGLFKTEAEAIAAVKDHLT